jgi:hypothetical protein
VEGDDVTDPEFLDEPRRYSGRSIRLDDREQLAQESIRESFSWWRPRPCLPRSDPPCINDLVVHRWYGRSPIPDLEVIRRVQAREGMAYDELLARYHRTVLKVANVHMSRYWRARRSPLRDKHTNTVFYEDLVAAGVASMWKATLKFDLCSGYAFWTGVRAPVLGAISDEARLWRRGGYGETRLDRWLYTHPTASPEQVLANQDRLYRVEERLARWLSEHPTASPEEILKKRERINRLLPFHSPQEAAEGIKLFWAWGGDTEIDFDEETEPAGPFASMYSCFSRYTLSPQLRIHERFSLVVDRLSGGLDTGPDVGEVSRPKTPREPLDCTEPAFIQFKNGKRQVARQRAAGPGYRIPITPALQAKAKEDLEFAKQRWQRRMRRGPLPAKRDPRWSTEEGLGRPEHENKQIVPVYIQDGRKWFVRYRGAEGELLSLLESPSRCCLKTRLCEFCDASSADHVALPSLPPRRAVGRRSAAVDIRSENSRTKPRAAETRLEQEKCQTQFAKQIATTRREKPYSSSPPGLPRRPRRTSRSR